MDKQALGVPPGRAETAGGTKLPPAAVRGMPWLRLLPLAGRRGIVAAAAGVGASSVPSLMLASLFFFFLPFLLELLLTIGRSNPRSDSACMTSGKGTTQVCG